MNYLGGEEIDSYSEDDFSAAPKRKKRRRILRVLALTVIGLLLGTTVAANISLSGGRVEFGQGVYLLQACDKWVAIGFSTIVVNGQLRVGSMTVIGLDPRRCAGSQFKVQMYTTGSATALDLYTGTIGWTGLYSEIEETGTVAAVTFKVSSTVPSSFADTAAYNTYASKALTLINKLNTNVCYADAHHSISYNNNDAVYTISFTSPLGSMASVNSVTIESATSTSSEPLCNNEI